MTIIFFIIHFISWAIFLYFAANTIYLLIMAICGRLIRGKQFDLQEEKFDVAVLIPCFQEDRIILDTARKVKEHDYPISRFSITVIADKLKPETIQGLKQIPVDVLEVNLSMKSRSLHAAFQNPKVSNSDIVMILDADNIMAHGCLEKVNAAFHSGCQAIQCHRTAKNTETPIALLDAMSEEININLFRRGPAVAGLSAAPVGSGMAFQTTLIREILSSSKILESPGEDREIDMQLMQRKIKMEFLDDALVYDEKVTEAVVFEKQRIRWLEAQFHHAGRFLDADMKNVRRSFFYFSKFFQILLLPRVLTILFFLFLSLLMVLQTILRVSILEPRPLAWLLMMGLFLLVLFISIPRRFYQWRTLTALTHLPILMFSMIKAVGKMKKRRREFLHTPKSFISGENESY